MAGWVLPWKVLSRCATLSASIPEFLFLWLCCVEPFVRGRRCCNVLLLWQEKEWTPHTQTHTHRYTYTLTHADSAGVRLKAKPRSCLLLITFFSCTFFPLVDVPRDRGRERKGMKGGREGGETAVIGKKASLVTHTGPSPFVLQLSCAALRGRETDREGVKLQRMLETCSSTLTCWKHKEWLSEGGCRNTHKDTIT